MLRQVQDSGVIPKDFEILFRLTIFKLANLRLGKTEPAAKVFLIERLAEQLKMTGVVSVCLENFADMLAFERYPEFVRFENSFRSWAGGARS